MTVTIAEVLDTLYLHDSAIEEIRYVPETQKLSLRISLCRYEGDGLGDIEEEVFTTLTFVDVRSFRLEAHDFAELWHNEIVKVTVTSHPVHPDYSTVELHLVAEYGLPPATLTVVAAAAFVEATPR